MDTTIRRASAADLDALVPLFDAYRMFYAQPSDPVRARDFLAERLANGESSVLVAERGPSAIGFTQLYPVFSSVRTARTWPCASSRKECGSDCQRNSTPSSSALATSRCEPGMLARSRR